MHAHKTWAVRGLRYVMILAFMTPAKLYENREAEEFNLTITKTFFCRKETKLNHRRRQESAKKYHCPL